MKHIILVLLIFCNAHLFSQNQNYIDSLLAIIKTLPDDTNKVKLLDEISYEYTGNSFEKAIMYANMELELSQKLKYKRGEAASYNSMGNAHTDKGDFANGLNYYIRCLKIYEKLSDQIFIIKSYNNIANIYLTQQDYDKALEYFFKVYNAMDLIKDKATEGNACNNIGIVYKNKKEYDKALEFHLKGLAARIQTGNKKSIASSYNNIGVTYQDMKQFDKAIESYKKSISLRKEINDLSGIASSLINLGKTYNMMKQFDNALPYLYEGEKYALLSGNENWRLNAYGNIVDSFEGLKDYKNESAYLMKYIALNDSLFNKEKSQQIIDMQTKYETEMKEKENKLLLQKNEIQQLEISRSNYLIIGILAILLFVILIAYLFIHQNKLNALQRTMQLEQQLLRSQMNPHFIFNSLTAIESYIYKNEPKEAGKYLANFARLMRLILENSREEYIPLSKEINTLEYYLQLQKNRFDNTFDYTIDLSDDIDPEMIAIPPMLAQPFIENSIEHGIRNIEIKGKIKISFRLNGEQLIFQVEDNGVGFNKSLSIKGQNEVHKSMATTITMERLDILNKRKKNKIRLLVNELKDSMNNVMGTQVSFAIPFKKR